MFTTKQAYSMVTTVLPNSTMSRVMPKLLDGPGANALVWKARGTLLHDHWLKRWFPPISPVKSMMQMIVPADEVTRVVGTVVEEGRLHQQSTGAIFSTPCDSIYLGSEFNNWPKHEGAGILKDQHNLTENLSVIYCIVGQKLSDRVAKAAIRAGSHGPIVYYSEGRGLRDRLGWLRITKEQDKEVLMVIADDVEADHVFNAMASAGDLHLPGKGFMYRVNIDKGMFHLPSRVSHHIYDANMQQIINAIDHLSGHENWRDQSVFDIGSQGKGVGLDAINHEDRILKDQVCLTALVSREHCPTLTDMLLDTGIPGVNMSYGRFTTGGGNAVVAHARVNEEYAMLRCITTAEIAAHVCQTVERDAEQEGLSDLCVMTNPVSSVATYVRGHHDYRQPSTVALAS